MLTPHEAKVEALRISIEKLPARDQTFAQSLIENYDDRGRLTDNQFVWIEKLLSRTTPEGAAALAAEVEILKPIVDLLTKASETLKKPAIRFALPDGTCGKLSLAPASGVNAGHIYVKDGSQYAGKITPQGAARLVGSGGRKAEILEALKKFAEAPVETAKAYGKETGCCCFCAKELTDKRSIVVGYGPTCATKYELPWGDASASEGEED